ncbi:MAG: KUP/HAK/KT family potassium transporter [Candidatus Binataceae bacterium]|jgi:KUP system potassium uptake protein
MAAAATPSKSPDAPKANRPTTAVAALTALGIVYGDLGTSPLYTLQTITEITGHKVTPPMMVGILSLIIWALILTISVKYCVFVMRADSNGEGGILILMSLLGEKWSSRKYWLLIAGLFGAALIYGDGIITPAISVLSAIEGVNVATKFFKPHIVPIAVFILLALFAIQNRGTATIGKVSGPVMLLWFITIAVLGITGIAHQPHVLMALNPVLAVTFLVHSGWLGFGVLGGVFLAVTGGEALYADMGHIGRNPIRTAWYIIVLPALLLSYAGQTALLLEHPNLTGNPFFHLAPAWAIYPLVILATLATIIASQAIITGSFSLTRQAMQLGWLPGMEIRQTSSEEYGQIYVPLVNWTMMAFTIALTIGFGSSVRLAGAYGTAVSTTMLLTTVLLYNVMRNCWRWPAAAAIPLCGIFLTIDFAFFAANLLKIADGGWIPLTFGAIIFVLMTTWRTGIEAVRAKLGAMTESTSQFFKRLAEDKIPRVAGTGVFLTRMDDAIPPPIIDHVAQVGALYQTLIALTVVFEEVPRLPQAQRLEIVNIFENFWHITVHYGFMEIPDLPSVLKQAKDSGFPIDLQDAIYFASRDEVISAKSSKRAMRWRLPLFAFMFRNSLRTSDLFNLPPHNYLEVGREVEI